MYPSYNSFKNIVQNSTILILKQFVEKSGQNVPFLPSETRNTGSSQQWPIRALTVSRWVNFCILLAIFSKINQSSVTEAQQTDTLSSPQKCQHKVSYHFILSLAQIRWYNKHRDVHITLAKQRQAVVLHTYFGWCMSDSRKRGTWHWAKHVPRQQSRQRTGGRYLTEMFISLDLMSCINTSNCLICFPLALYRENKYLQLFVHKHKPAHNKSMIIVRITPVIVLMDINDLISEARLMLGLTSEWISELQDTKLTLRAVCCWSPLLVPLSILTGVMQAASRRTAACLPTVH